MCTIYCQPYFVYSVWKSPECTLKPIFVCFLFVCLFVCLLVCLFVSLFVRSFVRSFVCSFKLSVYLSQFSNFSFKIFLTIVLIYMTRCTMLGLYLVMLLTIYIE